MAIEVGRDALRKTIFDVYMKQNLVKKHGPRKIQIHMKSSEHSTESSMLILRSGWGCQEEPL
jgi:hypothetical protein